MRNRRDDFRDRILDLAIAEGPLHLSAVVFYELMYGAFHSGDPARQIDKVDRITGFFQIENWTRGDAEAAAKIRSELGGQGIAIDDSDSMIAGQALTRGWSVVTRNIRHF